MKLTDLFYELSERGLISYDGDVDDDTFILRFISRTNRKKTIKNLIFYLTNWNIRVSDADFTASVIEVTGLKPSQMYSSLLKVPYIKEYP